MLPKELPHVENTAQLQEILGALLHRQIISRISLLLIIRSLVQVLNTAGF